MATTPPAPDSTDGPTISPASMNWHENAFFGIHYDFHAQEKDANLGAELTPDLLRERLSRIRPDWIHCDCKGHAGYTSWPTRVGSTSPGVVKDSLRIYRDVTRELGIRLGMHYSGVWDTRAIQLHPEWGRIDAEGNRDPRITCLQSRYVEELMIPQLLEIIDTYDVDGFWVDGDNWAARPCWCERCRAEFTRRTGLAEAPSKAGDRHWFAWLAFHRDLFDAYVAKWTSAVKKRKPDCCVTSSYMYGARQPEPQMTVALDYLSGDLDFRWGAEHAQLEARVYDARRSISGLPWDLMAWMHTKPGEMGDPRPWVLKPAIHLMQELSEVLALGGAAMVYENPQRSGHLIGWHHEVIRQVSDFCRARQAACFRTQSVPQVAVLHFADHFYRHNNILYQYEPATDPIEGAIHALTEAGLSVDVLTEDVMARRLREYPLAVVPEITGLTPAQQEMLRGYVAAGGKLLMSGAHLARACGPLVGANPEGDPVEGEVHLPRGWLTVRMFGAWQPVSGDAVPLARRWRGAELEKDGTDQVLITLRAIGEGSLLAVHGPMFGNYFAYPHPTLQSYIEALVRDALGFVPRVQMVGASPKRRLEVVLRHEDGQLRINLINRGPGIALPPKRILIDELTPIRDVALRIACPQEPRRIRLEPAGQDLEFSWRDGVADVRVPAVEIHEILMVD